MRNCVSCGAAVAPRFKYCDNCHDTRAPWRVDPVNLDRACKHLGIEVEVQVKRVATRELLGRYHGIKLRDGAPTDLNVIKTMSDDEINAFMYHKITVSTRLTPAAASRVLWHELTHAAQYEDDPNEYVAQYREEYDYMREVAAETGTSVKKTYSNISYEIKARANEGLHSSMFPLTLPNFRANMPSLRQPHSRIDRVENGVIYHGHLAEAFERWSRKSIRSAKMALKS